MADESNPTRQYLEGFILAREPAEATVIRLIGRSLEQRRVREFIPAF